MASNENVHDGNHKGVPAEKAIASDNDVVAKPTALYDSKKANWDLLAATIGGTEAMRAAGKQYLKQHPYEGDDNFKDRLAVAVFDNYTLDCLNALVGKAFKQVPALAEEFPEKLAEFQADIDLSGTGFVPFCREWFRRGIQDHVAYVLIDMPVPQARQDGKPRTLADDVKENIRPFWRLITGPEMIGPPRYERIGGKMEITQVRFKDDEMVPDGPYGERLSERIKVINRETWEVWEKQSAGAKKSKWVLLERGINSLGKVPVVSFMTDKEKSPLVDLAHLNVRHWQSNSDQDNILGVARFPILGGSGISGADAESVVIGPRQFLSVKDPQGKLYYVEHEGKAIEAGTTHLERLEDRMSSYGAEYTSKQAEGPETATGRVLDEGEAISPLQAWGLDFKDAMEQAWALTAEWVKMDGDDEKIIVDFSVEAEAELGSPETLTALREARKNRDISRKAYLTELQKNEVLSEEFDIDDDAEELESEAPDDDEESALGDMFGKDGDPKKKPEEKPKGRKTLTVVEEKEE